MSFRKRPLKNRRHIRIFSAPSPPLFVRIFSGMWKGICSFFGIFFGIFSRKKKSTSVKKTFLRAVIFMGIALCIALLWAEYGQNAGKKIVKNTFFALGADLPKDKNGFTNILLLGAGGGELHAGKGSKLTDSIIIASIDADGKSVVMFSLPRDFYVETDHVHGRINEIVRDESRYFLKDLKKIPENAARIAELSGQKEKEFLWKLDAQADALAVEMLKKEIENIFQIDIQRVARIDFRGFESFVDAIGGVDVYVEKTINDPTYPDYEWGYNPFLLRKGQHHLDGETALQYARSRHGSSDFDRAKRQQNLLSAIKARMTSLSLLTSPSKIRNVLDVIQEYFISDISWDEIITLGKIADSLPRENISSYVLNDDPTQPGGFLVTPSRELYGGAFVLVPFLNLEKNKYAQIRAFLKVIFDKRALTHISPVPITILNGTHRVGIAGTLMMHLERFGWKIADVGNVGDTVKKTTIYYSNTPKAKKTAEILQVFLDSSFLQAKPSSEETESIEVVLGEDYSAPRRIPHLSSL